MKIKQSIAVLTTFVIVCGALLCMPAIGQTNTKLTDPEIASVAVTANQIDIEYAQIAQKKSKNTDVLKFAETMAKDHQSVIDQAVALAKKLGVTPKDNATTKSFLAGAVKTKAMLNSKKGNAFNKAYIDNEVAYHKAAINEVENVLIPGCNKQRIKKFIAICVTTFQNTSCTCRNGAKRIQ